MTYQQQVCSFLLNGRDFAKLIAPTALATIVQDAMPASQGQHLTKDKNHRQIQVDNLFGSGKIVKRERNSFRAMIADYANSRIVYASLSDGDGPLSEFYTIISNVQLFELRGDILRCRNSWLRT